jgi:hypothetical protein
MIGVLERTSTLIRKIESTKICDFKDVYDELKACSVTLDAHIIAQKRQKPTEYNDKYVYDKNTKTNNRVYK